MQDRRIGRLSARAVPVDAARRMLTRADATTEIYSAFFVEAAGTRSRVRGLREGMEPPGRVRSLSPRPGCARRAHRGGGRPRRQASVDAGAPHRAGPTARSVGAGRDSGAGGGQPVSARARSPAASYPVSGGGHGTGPRLLPRGRPAPRRDSVCARGAGRGPGEYGAVAGAAPADPAESPPRCLARSHTDGPLIETGRAHPAPTHRSDVPPIVHPRPTVRDTMSARGGKTR